jgi:UDP:flavonoid glycosyltransferase YjiC (YdhE family)
MQSILDNAKGGAVLVSFGSMADSRKMSLQMLSGMLAAFSRFPKVQFVMKLDEGWKQNQTALFAAAPNVHAFEWVEQAAILGKEIG